MSTGRKLPFVWALELAGQLVEELRPHVERVKVAGSLRRKRPEVSDIELVVEPRLLASDLFGGTTTFDVETVRAVVSRWGTLAKCGNRFMQIYDLCGHAGVTLDAFLVHPPAQWGSILAIRTGPAELGQWAVTRMRERGLRHVDGHVETEAGVLVPTPTEAHFFAAAGLPCLPPHLRDTPAAMRPLETEVTR